MIFIRVKVYEKKILKEETTNKNKVILRKSLIANIPMPESCSYSISSHRKLSTNQNCNQTKKKLKNRESKAHTHTQIN